MDSIKRIAGNAASILTSNIIGRAISFVTYALVARFLGAFQFGQLSLAVALFSTFQFISVAGLSTITTREVAKNRSHTERYFVNASVAVLFTSAVSMIVLLVIVRILDYAPDTSFVIFLLTLGLVPYALSQISEAIFIAWEEMHLIAYANVPSNVMQIVVVIVLLVLGLDVRYVALTMAAVYLMILVIDWFLLFRVIRIPKAKFELPFVIQIVKSASTFLGVQGINAVRSNIAIVILSKFVTETELGIYNAAAQLSIPLRLIVDNFASSIFPVMVRRFEASQEALKRIAHNTLELLMATTLPGSVGAFLLAGPLIFLIYGAGDFMQSVNLLQIMIWIPLLKVVTTVIGKTLWASGRERITLRIAIFDVLIKVVLSVILISQLGLIGAPIAVLLEEASNVVMHYLPVAKMLPLTSLPGLLWKSAFSAGMMALLLIPVRSQALYVSIPVGIVSYTLTIMGISVLTAGGVTKLKRKYVQLWSE